MRASVICFTLQGVLTGERIRDGLSENGADCTLYCKKRGFEPDPSDDIKPIKESLREWTGSHFAEDDLLVFVGAAGIAVRAVSPFVSAKTSDPAVVVVDEQGKYAISLLSGHIGRGNEYTRITAQITGAVPVITTATDLEGRFAVDVFAQRSGLVIGSMALAKECSARILDGERIRLETDFPLSSDVPGEIIIAGESGSGPDDRMGPADPGYVLTKQAASEEAGCRQGIYDDRGAHDGLKIRISVYETEDPGTLLLIPKAVTLGIGCRRGKDPETLEAFVRQVLKQERIDIRSVEKICSIDVKKDEPALIRLSEKLGVPFETFDAEALAGTAGEFSASSFVKQQVGVDNVCERSAVYGSGGRLIIRKQAGDGVTLAAACRQRRISFE